MRSFLYVSNYRSCIIITLRVLEPTSSNSTNFDQIVSKDSFDRMHYLLYHKYLGYMVGAATEFIGYAIRGY